MLTQTITQLPPEVDLTLEEITDVMLPPLPQQPGQLEVRVNVTLNWANHGLVEHEIRELALEFLGDGFPARINATLASPLLARPTSPGIFMRQDNVSLIILFEDASALPDEITCQSLREAGMDLSHRRRCPSPAGDTDYQLGLLPRLEALERDVHRRLRGSLTNDQLDQAMQLLQTPGAHDEAMGRAAGIIAGVVLNRHLSDLVDKVNDTLGPREQYKRSIERDGIVRYTNWLIAQGLIEPIERAGLEALAVIQTRCTRTSSEKLQPPSPDEVAQLIGEVRRIITEIPLR